MIKSLKIKILLSFTLLILMLAIAGIMSIVEFKNIGNSVNEVLENNYQSIELSKSMLDAIEREDSGILLWMLGDTQTGRETIAASDSTFRRSIDKTEKNITEENEEIHIESIKKHYATYRASILDIINHSSSLSENKRKYDLEATPAFFKIKEAINDLMVLNQDQMYKQSSVVKEKSKRAMMPAIVSIVAAVIFAILLNFFISVYFINPLKQLIKSIKGFYPEQVRLHTHITSKDEIKTLEEEINSLIARLLRKRSNE